MVKGTEKVPTRQDNGSGMIFTKGNVSIPGIDKSYQFGGDKSIDTPLDRKPVTSEVQYNPEDSKPLH